MQSNSYCALRRTRCARNSGDSGSSSSCCCCVVPRRRCLRLYASGKFRAPVTHGRGKSYRAICLPRRDDRVSEAEKNRRIAREDRGVWLNRQHGRSRRRCRRRSRYRHSKRWPMSLTWVPTTSIEMLTSGWLLLWILNDEQFTVSASVG